LLRKTPDASLHFDDPVALLRALEDDLQSTLGQVDQVVSRDSLVEVSRVYLTRWRLLAQQSRALVEQVLWSRPLPIGSITVGSAILSFVLGYGCAKWL
jgi:hypothetical protein